MESMETEYLNASQENNATTNLSNPVTLVDMEHIPLYFNVNISLFFLREYSL